MNKIVLSIALVLMSGATLFGQSRPNAQAASYVDANFVGATEIVWNVTANGSEAQMLFNDHETIVSFDNNGALIATETHIKWVEVPQVVMRAHKESEHKYNSPYDMYKVVAASGDVQFHIFVNNSYNNNPQNLIFAADGKIINVVNGAR
jgi:hypothetical protein